MRLPAQVAAFEDAHRDLERRCVCGRVLGHRMEARCEPCKLDELRAGAHSLPDRGRRITVTYRRRADRSVEILGVDTHGWTLTRTDQEDDVGRKPHPDGPRAARLVLNEGLSITAAAAETGLSQSVVIRACERYRAEHPLQVDVDEWLSLRTACPPPDGATLELVADGRIVVTFANGRRDTYWSPAHYAGSYQRRCAGAARGTATIVARAEAKDSGAGATPAGGTTENTPAPTDPAPPPTTDAPDDHSPASGMAGTPAEDEGDASAHQPEADPPIGTGDPTVPVDADPAIPVAPVSEDNPTAAAEDPSVALASTAAPTSWGADDPASWITPDDLQRHVATIDQADELAEAQSRLIAAEGDLADVQHQADFWKSRYEDAVRRLDVANAALAHRNGHSAGPTPREHALWMALVLLRAAIVEHSYTSAVKPLVDAAMETAGAPS